MSSMCVASTGQCQMVKHQWTSAKSAKRSRRQLNDISTQHKGMVQCPMRRNDSSDICTRSRSSWHQVRSRVSRKNLLTWFPGGQGVQFGWWWLFVPRQYEDKITQLWTNGTPPLWRPDHMPKERKGLNGKPFYGVIWQKAIRVKKYVHTSVDISMMWVPNASSQCKTLLYSHANTTVVGNSWFIVHEHGSSVDVWSIWWWCQGMAKSDTTIDDAISHINQHIGYKCILMLNQAIYIKEQSITWWRAIWIMLW